MSSAARLLPLLLMALPCRAQEEYGAKGIYPVYEASGQWLIFDKKPAKERSPLALGRRFLVVGSEGAQVFEVARASGTYGGACRRHKPLKLSAALLKGPRSAVGRPIIGISVPDGFSLKGSRAVYRALKNEVTEEHYRRYGETLRRAAVEDAKSGAFRFALQDEKGYAFLRDPRPEAVQYKIDFGARPALKGLAEPFAFIEESQISASYRRCLRLADGEKLVGECVEMPRSLMAETSQLQFVAYDPSGGGSPLLLAFTRVEPHWGDERWGFALRAEGPRLVVQDAMDIRCREAF